MSPNNTENTLFEIELVRDTSLEAAALSDTVGDDTGDDGGGASNSNSTNNASDMP